MCKKCSHTVSIELNKQLSDLERECVVYKTALEKLLAKRAESPFDEDTAKRKLETMKV